MCPALSGRIVAHSENARPRRIIHLKSALLPGDPDPLIRGRRRFGETNPLVRRQTPTASSELQSARAIDCNFDKSLPFAGARRHAHSARARRHTSTTEAESTLTAIYIRQSKWLILHSIKCHQYLFEFTKTRTESSSLVDDCIALQNPV